jgi:hypothetical protein
MPDVSMRAVVSQEHKPSAEPARGRLARRNAVGNDGQHHLVVRAESMSVGEVRSVVMSGAADVGLSGGARPGSSAATVLHRQLGVVPGQTRHYRACPLVPRAPRTVPGAVVDVLGEDPLCHAGLPGHERDHRIVREVAHRDRPRTIRNTPYASDSATNPHSSTPPNVVLDSRGWRGPGGLRPDALCDGSLTQASYERESAPVCTEEYSPSWGAISPRCRASRPAHASHAARHPVAPARTSWSRSP